MLSELVTQGNRLADVGTDHGYVPIYLLERGRIPSAIAMDINQGPLDRAREHIWQYGYETYIEIRQSDGLEALKAGEADTVLIAGMGGALMQRILREGRPALCGVRELILQPQSELYQMRKFLGEQGYHIAREYMVYEDGKYYPIMKIFMEQDRAQENDTLTDGSYTEAELYFGKAGLQQNRDVWKAYLEKNLCVQQQILDSLSGASGVRSGKRRQEVQRMISCLRECQENLAELK